MAFIEQPTSSGQTIIFVHGRGSKPDPDALQELWTGALRAGLTRDFAKQPASSALDQTTLVTAYYGDLTNAVRAAAGKTYDEALDVADLDNALANLKALGSAKKFRRAGYEALPGRSSMKEFLADIGAPVLSTLGLTEAALARRMPELSAYWDPNVELGIQARQRTLGLLRDALERGDEIMVISHCLGSIVAYDCLWELSQNKAAPAAATTAETNRKIHSWITLGSPLGDEFVKRKLAGARQRGAARYPSNIVNWYNVAAEDDFTCHDETLANDFKPMLQHHLVSRIKDYRIYNLAIRYGRSNPHTGMGYLIHPRVAKLVGKWLHIDSD